jgi:hypothetical protein
MRVIDPGHVYELEWLDGYPQNFGILGETPSEHTLTFVKREGAGYPGNVGHHAGTNLQEVLRALIDRVKYLDGQISHPNNAGLLVNLRHSLWLLEQRAAERHGRPFEISWAAGIEELPTCSSCGHIGCEGKCHEKPATTKGER